MESSQNDQDITETLIKLRELTDLAKNNIKLDLLQTAISSLQEALDKRKYEDKRATLQYYLTRALLTRFGLYKWIGDLDKCFQYFSDVESLIESAGQDGHGEIIEVKLATQAIQDCRRSLNIDILNTLTEIAEAAVTSYTNDSFTPGPQMFDLLIVLGNTYLLKYMKQDSVAELDHASKTFQEAERLCAGHVSYSYISLTSNAHIEWLRLTECGDRTAFSRFCDYLIMAESVDEEGTSSFNNGIEMVESAVDESQLQEAITLLSTALRHRTDPHPRRASSLHNLARALLTRFKRRGDMQDLEAGITLNEQSLRLRPINHPERALSLNILAAAHFIRYQSIGHQQDLQASITLYRECLHLWPPPHPNRPSLLSNLAAALLKESSHGGNNEGLSEAISLLRESVSNHTPHHPDRSMSLNNLASALRTRFEQEGNSQDLEECFALHQEALELTRNLRPKPHPQYIHTLDHLAVTYTSRFKHKGDLLDLEKCISLHREALDLRPAASPYRSSSLSNLATALFTRFSQRGHFQDLEEAIVFHQDALARQPIPHPHRSMTLNNLASALSTRYRQYGDLRDLDQCLVLHREALELRSTSHPDRSMSLENLGLALVTSFEQKGTFQDLEESIGLLQEALSLHPSPHPSRLASLGKLAGALFIRFRQKGTFQDLENCISLLREELDLQPNAHPDRPSSLNNLAAALVTRFEQREGFHNLEESIQLYYEALESWPAPHPHRSMSLTNLANALCTRFSKKGIIEDLDQCIFLYREALELQSTSYPARSDSLNNLGIALSTRFSQTQVLQDLEECISTYREALGLQPAPHPHRSAWLMNLARALSTRVEYKHRESQYEESNVEEVLRCYEEASKYETGSIVNRFNSTHAWANFAKAHRPNSALDAYRYGIELLPQLASLDLTLKQRQDVLEHCREFVSNAAKCAIDANHCDLAITFLTIGRSIFWSQALQLRTPADELTVTHPVIAARFTAISGQLERASYSGPDFATDITDAKHPSIVTKFTSFHALVDERRQIIEEIRRIPGFENFLRPHSFSSLQSAAENGPVILLNASDLGCDALVIRHTGPVVHVPLPDIHLVELESLKANVHALSDVQMRSGASKQMSDEVRLSLGRDMLHSAASSEEKEPLRLVLEGLWVRAVQPVLNALRLEKTNSPGRIWWCPTGPFSSLPIHAAGIYSVENDPIDCLFEYAVSSYCTSPQDLLQHQPPIDQSFTMTAIIEPEAPGAALLPATREELMRINDHIPNHKNLITHVGLRGIPTNVDNLLSDIQRSSFVHFGCHGMQNLNNSLESYLLLSGGKLTMSRIIQECQVPEGALAYLSACETAKGDEIRPDESLNLVATMMFAGFRSVVGTMWSILDEDAPIVAGVFYRHLFRNREEAPPDVRDAAYGLHLATQELRDRRKPFYSWVPYVHYGI